MTTKTGGQVMERQVKLLYEILEDCYLDDSMTDSELEEIAHYLHYLRNPWDLNEVGRRLEKINKRTEVV